MRINLDSYINLISDLVKDKISAECFEYSYLELFTEETGKMTEEEYVILNTIFFDVEDFCKYPEIRGERDIDEGELKKRCKVALEKLKKLEKVAIDKSSYKNIGININLYIEFINARLYGRISVECFKYIYKKNFGEDTFRMAEDEHEILNELYIDLGSLGGIELRRRCEITLEKLKMINEEKNGT